LPSVSIKDIEDPDEVRRVVEVEARAWGTSETTPPHIFIAGRFAGGILKGAYVDGRLVGYVFGIPGVYRGRLCHYSHQLAVDPEYRNLGIGRLLKLAQREECLKRGLDLVIWTFDPLQSLNCHFNLRKLSVIVRTYLVNHYGEMRDSLNFGLPSDRFLAEWWIRSRWVVDRLEGKSPGLFASEAPNPLIEVRRGDPPTPSDPSTPGGDAVSVPVPASINEVKRRSRDAALRWRLATREAYLEAFRRGYVAVDYVFDKKEGVGYCVLRRDLPLDELLKPVL